MNLNNHNGRHQRNNQNEIQNNRNRMQRSNSNKMLKNLAFVCTEATAIY